MLTNAGIWKILGPMIFPAARKAKKKGGAPLLPSPPEESHVSLLAGENEGARMLPPKGCLAVYVGAEMRRFVIPASYLCLPPFRALMAMVEEEFGFEQEGGLRIPCEIEAFEQTIRALEGLGGGGGGSRHGKTGSSKKTTSSSMPKL